MSLRGRFDSANLLFKKTLQGYEHRYSAIFPEGHIRIALALGDLGRESCAAGDYEEAEEYHLRSLEMRRRLFGAKQYPDGHPSIANALRDLGIVCYFTGRLEEASRRFAESAQIEHAIADSFACDSSEALLLNLAARKFQSLDYLLSSWHGANQPAGMAYELVWLRRGFVPQKIQKRNYLFRRLAAKRDNTLTLVDEYIELRRGLARTLLVSGAQDDPMQSVRLDSVLGINVQMQTLETRLAGLLDGLENDGPGKDSSPAQLSKLLPVNAVLVDFVKYACHPTDVVSAAKPEPKSERMLGFVVARGRPISCVDLGDARKIEQLVADWRQAALDDRGDDDGEMLRRAVWDPVAGLFPAETHTVYVAPDGALSLVAWGALPSPVAGLLLIEKYAIATVPHGPFLVEQLRREGTQENPSDQVLVVGDIDYGVPPDAATGLSVGLKRLNWLPLQGSAAEMASVAAAAGERKCLSLSGTNATPLQVMEQLPQARCAHFATHGFFVDSQLEASLELASERSEGRRLTVNPSRSTVLARNPFIRSGLALSGANRLGPLDELGVPLRAEGILTAEEVAALDCRHLELVVLSACETGRGDVIHGDGVFSIQTAFHVAGARNVIATLWKVDDQVTAELMREFYRLLWDEGLSPLEALRASQLHMMRLTAAHQPEPRGPELAGVVPLPKPVERTAASARCQVRKWAGFVLSGPGF